MIQRLKRQRGDTLVEVLICILLVSVILTGAYVTSNRSTRGIRDAQEHAEALKLVQGQLEQIRQNAGTSATPPVITQPVNTKFCMVNSVLTSATIQPEAAKCIQDSGGNPTTQEPAYVLTATRATCTVGASCHQFTIQATWDSITGDGKATEQIIYRLHP